MGHQVQPYQVQPHLVQPHLVQPSPSGDGEKLWLSTLIDTMETVARLEYRAVPCDRLVLARVIEHLERPASLYPPGASRFSLRN